MNMQEMVTKRIEAELGNLIVQLTIKNLEIEQLRAENDELKKRLEPVGTIPILRPESGPVKEASNGNK